MHLHLPITLVVIWLWECLFYVEAFAEGLEFVWNEITTRIWHYFLWYSILCKKWFYMLILGYLLIGLQSSWQLETCYGNLKCMILFIIESKHVSTDYVPWSYWYVVMDYFVLQLYLLKCKTCGTVFFIKLSMSLLMFSSIWTHALVVLFFLYPCD